MCLASGRGSPKQEDEPFPLPRQGFYDGIGEGFPPSARMAECLVGTDAEAGVEQEHSLPCPTGEVATLWYGSTRFRLYLLKDVPERWRKWYAVLNREAKSVCLPVAMVGVLPQDDHLNVVERCLVEGIEDEPCRRKALHGAILLADEVGQLPEVWLLKLGGEPGFPTLLHADVFHNRKTEMGKRKTISHPVFRFHLSVYFIRHLPVISSGCSRPMMWRMLGATSASTPSSTLASLLAVT